MHRGWAAAEALLLPGLRLCIWFFISNRLMCSDTAPLWEGADRHCQYFLPKKPPTNAALQSVAFQLQIMQRAASTWREGSQSNPCISCLPGVHFFVVIFLLLLRKKERNVNIIRCHFWQLLDWVMLMSMPGCCAVKLEVLQYSGVRHPKPGVGMKVRKIKHRRLEECFLPLCLCCSAVLLLHFDILTVLLSNFSIVSKARNSP